jgi:hypothetical protein
MEIPIVAVRAPEYWPRIRVMALVDASDRFVLGDTLQYSRQSHQNRTLVRTPQGSQWLSVPLEGGQHGRPIGEVAIADGRLWLRKHWRALQYNYRTSPFFEFYEPELAPLFERSWRTLGELTCTSVRVLGDLFGIDTFLSLASSLDGAPGSIEGIRAAVGACSYLAAADMAATDRKLTKVGCVMHVDAPEYRQNFAGFEPGMSALDLLFNYGPEALSMLRRAASVRPDSIIQT